MAQTFEMNKDNWSGEHTTLTVEDDGTFEVYGYKFKLDIKADPHNNGGKFDAHTAKVVSVDGTWSHPLAGGCKFACDDFWEFHANDITRESTNPYIAAAKILFNIL